MAPLDTWLKAAGHISTSFLNNPFDHHLDTRAAQWYNPLRCCGVDNAFENSFIDLKRAISYAKKAADPVFLAVPQGVPLQQALKSAPRWSWHYESGAKAVAHLTLAQQEMTPWRTNNPALDTTPVNISSIDSTTLASTAALGTLRNSAIDFI